MKKILVCASAIALLSCSKQQTTFKKELVNGVEIVSNQNKPSQPNFKLNLTDSVSLDLAVLNRQEGAEPIQMNNAELDREGNIYILDALRSRIHKFDKAGKKIKSFGGRGQGPGEFLNAGFFVVWHDTIYVPFMQSLKILKFNTNGDYLTDKRYTNISDMPQMFWKTRNFITGVSGAPVPEEGDGVFRRYLSIFNNRFEKLRTFWQDKLDINNPVIDLNQVQIPSLAVSTDSLIYVPKYSSTEYCIEAFDLSGKKRKVIRKNYQTIPFSENELKRINGHLARDNRSAKGKYKNSIALLNTDKYNRLWVTAAQKDGNKDRSYDVFEKGIFLNRVHLPMDSTAVMDFVEDKLVIYDVFKNRVKYYNY